MSDDTAGKACTKCGVIQPLSEFTRQPNNSDRLHAHCRTCSRERNRRWYAEKAKRDPDWVARRCAKTRAYYRGNTETVLAKGREYARSQRLAKGDEVRAKRRERYASNPEHYRVKHLEYANARRARKQGNIVTAVQYRQILAEHGMVCHICAGVIESRADLHFDHVIPLSKGGEHSPQNIRPAHAKCNISKGARVA